MSASNITAFLDKVRQDEVLSARVAAIHHEAQFILAEAPPSQTGTSFTDSPF